MMKKGSRVRPGIPPIPPRAEPESDLTRQPRHIYECARPARKDVDEPCPLCGREKLKNRIQRPPPTTADVQAYCLHPAHIYDQVMPPCEQLGIERIKALETAVLEATRHLLGKCDCLTGVACAFRTEAALAPFVETGSPPEYEHRLVRSPIFVRERGTTETRGDER